MVDVTPPDAALTAHDIATSGDTKHQFTVTFTDDQDLTISTLGDGNLRVRGPGVFQQQATLVSATAASNVAQLTATYQVTAPGGEWDADDNGIYEVWMLPLQISDLAHNYVPFGRLGTFTVTIDPFQVSDVPEEAGGVISDDRLEFIAGQLRVRPHESLTDGSELTLGVDIAVPDTSSVEPKNPMVFPLIIQTAAWCNPADRYDVTGDGRISPLDALTVITELNTRGIRSLPLLPATATLEKPFYDVNGDHKLSPIDARLVITRLNNPPASDAEGESVAATVAAPANERTSPEHSTAAVDIIHPLVTSPHQTQLIDHQQPRHDDVMDSQTEVPIPEASWLDSGPQQTDSMIFDRWHASADIRTERRPA